jgi:urate oxidase
MARAACVSPAYGRRVQVSSLYVCVCCISPQTLPLSLEPHQLVGTPLAAVHYFVEYTVHTMLESDMAHAFLTDSNRGMTATDTQKNMVYVVAKAMQQPCSPEEFGVALAKKFVDSYPLVSKAKVAVEMAPWRRLNVSGQVSTVRLFNVSSLPDRASHPHTSLLVIPESRTTTTDSS